MGVRMWFIAPLEMSARARVFSRTLLVFSLSSLVFEWEGDVTLGPISIEERVVA